MLLIFFTMLLILLKSANYYLLLNSLLFLTISPSSTHINKSQCNTCTVQRIAHNFNLYLHPQVFSIIESQLNLLVIKSFAPLVLCPILYICIYIPGEPRVNNRTRLAIFVRVSSTF